MKAVFAKSLVVLAGAVLVVPFVAVALLVGAQAAAGAGGDQRLVLAALALGATLLGGVKGLKGRGPAWRHGHVPRAPRRARKADPVLP